MGAGEFKFKSALVSFPVDFLFFQGQVGMIFFSPRMGNRGNRIRNRREILKTPRTTGRIVRVAADGREREDPLAESVCIVW